MRRACRIDREETREQPPPRLPRTGSAGLPMASDDMLRFLDFVEDMQRELEHVLPFHTPDAYLHIATHLIRNHLEAKLTTVSSLAMAARVPYATAMRRIKEMQDDGLILQRSRTRSGKSYSLHPSQGLIDAWYDCAHRVKLVVGRTIGFGTRRRDADYFFGSSFCKAHTITPLTAQTEPLKLTEPLRLLVHADPTFMVMETLKRQFEQIMGTKIAQRALSIDRLREEALRNAQRKTSQYDIIAVDLPWIGEFADKGVLLPLDDAMDIERLDPSDFHAAGWQAVHWAGRPYGVPSQTTPELLFYRRDLFAEAGLAPPTTTTAVLAAAERLHDPVRGRYGIAWNAAQGTALGHTFMMACADYGQPLFNLPAVDGSFVVNDLHRRDIHATIDTPGGQEAAEYLLALMRFSPPDILSMSWYERVRPYAAGTIAMAYGYTLLAPYFELDPASPACGQTEYLPHPAGPRGQTIAPVGGYVLGIPSNLPAVRRADAVEALITFTSPGALKLFIENGSRTNPRHSVGADPDVRRLSPIFEAVDAMSWRNELQYWPRPPIPEISEIIQICGQEFHTMLRGMVTPKEALKQAQARADAVMRTRHGLRRRQS